MCVDVSGGGGDDGCCDVNGLVLSAGTFLFLAISVSRECVSIDGSS